MTNSNSIKMIAAVSQNGVIGVTDDQGKGTIPWRHKADMKRFKEMTVGTTVIMGRKTWDSLPPKMQPLPDRRNIVISRSPHINNAVGVDWFTDLPSAIFAATGTVWLIGGESIYQEGMNHAQHIDLTLVPETITAPTVVRFPWINPLTFDMVATQHDVESGLTHVTYRRK